MYCLTVIVQNAFWRAARLWQEFCDHEVFMIVGVNAEAMEPNAYHTAEYWDVDDSASAVVCRESFMVASRIDVFQNVEALKEHKVDSALATIVGAKTMIAKQVSDCRPAGITWVRLEPRAAVLPVTAASTRTTRITSNGLSWDRANPRSLAGGMVSYLVLKRLVIAYDSEELIEGGGHEFPSPNYKMMFGNFQDEVRKGVQRHH